MIITCPQISFGASSTVNPMIALQKKYLFRMRNKVETTCTICQSQNCEIFLRRGTLPPITYRKFLSDKELRSDDFVTFNFRGTTCRSCSQSLTHARFKFNHNIYPYILSNVLHGYCENCCENDKPLAATCRNPETVR